MWGVFGGWGIGGVKGCGGKGWGIGAQARAERSRVEDRDLLQVGGGGRGPLSLPPPSNGSGSRTTVLAGALGWGPLPWTIMDGPPGACVCTMQVYGHVLALDLHTPCICRPLSRHPTPSLHLPPFRTRRSWAVTSTAIT